MESQASGIQYKVGIFIGVCLASLMISILLLGGDKFFASYIELHVRFDEVQGLFPGSVVSLAGMPIGNVNKIQFLADANQLDITMKIDASFHKRLTEGTTAEIRTQGALGDKYLYLAPGPNTAKILASGSVVPGIDTDYMKLLTDREDGVARIIDLIKETQTLVASVNAGGKAAEIVRNTAEVTGKLKTTMGQIDGLVGEIRGNIPENKKLKGAMISLANILEKVDQGKGTIGQLINDPTLYQNLKAYLGGSPRNRYMKDMIRETIQKSDTQ